MTTINELIKKYEDIIKCLEKTQAQRFNHTTQMKINIFKKILQDLKQLKEKIIKRQFTKSYISTNQDNSLMAVESMIKEIIGE